MDRSYLAIIIVISSHTAALGHGIINPAGEAVLVGEDKAPVALTRAVAQINGRSMGSESFDFIFFFLTVCL